NAPATNGDADFNEVRDLIRANLVGVTDAELEVAALDGLLERFAGKVTIVPAAEAPVAPETRPLTRSTVLGDSVAYVRVGVVASGLPDALLSAWREMEATNELNGLVIDLRFAGGDDYAAAAATANLFTAREQTLLDWGSDRAKSKADARAITVPVTVLVNAGTRAAAEALAAVVRETGAGLILGGRTAGEAAISRNFPLKNGDILRIATATVKLGDGTPIPANGIEPDITVAVTPQAELSYFENAYAVLGKTNAPLPALAAGSGETRPPARRPRLNEADLVRQHREGNGGQNGDAPRAAERRLETPVIRDPALARAVDLLKGLAVVKSWRS
ncbi:MAG TPA: S41 family peptidase, partial [Verrucomicrobiota bacterium]|nr:S41 family peptidase [Verrucomicrobiota bacterium]